MVKQKNRVGNNALSADEMGCCSLDEKCDYAFATLYPHSLHIFLCSNSEMEMLEWRNVVLLQDQLLLWGC